MRHLPIVIALLGASCTGAEAPARPPNSSPPEEPESLVRFSFAVNGLEHGNGAL